MQISAPLRIGHGRVGAVRLLQFAAARSGNLTKDHRLNGHVLIAVMAFIPLVSVAGGSALGYELVAARSSAVLCGRSLSGPVRRRWTTHTQRGRDG